MAFTPGSLRKETPTVPRPQEPRKTDSTDSVFTSTKRPDPSKIHRPGSDTTPADEKEKEKEDEEKLEDSAPISPEGLASLLSGGGTSNLILIIIAVGIAILVFRRK